jgi:hypothetical protein
MPSLSHEELVELFRSDPEIAVELLRRVSKIELPPYQRIDLKPAELVELIPVSYRADVLLLLLDSEPVFALVVEVQLGRDADKRFSWPLYVTAARARYRCPACLLVYAPEEGIAKWCAEAIELGQPGSAFRPLVCGPPAIPKVTNPAEAAQHPYRAVLSAVAHGWAPEAEAIGRAALRAVEAFPSDERATWEEVILAGLNEAARKALEAWMNLQGYPEKSRFYQLGEAAGEVKAEVKAVLKILAARGMPVSDGARARIAACTDPAVLERWIERAVTAATVDELFEPEG